MKHYKSVYFCQTLQCQTPRTNVKNPCLRPSGDSCVDNEQTQRTVMQV